MSARWRLVLARHGQTLANVEHVLDTGLPGPDLTDLGRRQAAALGRELLDGVEGPVTAVYHSHAARAIETAAIAADVLALVPRPVEGAYEVQAGVLEGRSDQEAVETFRTTFDAWLTGEMHRRLPGAETGFEVVDRLRRGVTELRTLHPAGGTLVLVGHGGSIRLLATDLVGAQAAPAPTENHLDNCGRVVLDRDDGSGDGSDQEGGRWRLVAWRDAVPGGLPSTRDVTDDATG